MKYVYLIGDGMADRPLKELDGQTVLEYAYTPYMDSFAVEGCTGMMTTAPEDMPVNSDVCIMSLMGYDPKKYYTGRSPIEAASVGVDIGSDQIVFRCNLVTIEDNTMKSFSGVNVTNDEAKALLKTLDEKCEEQYEFFLGVSYRNIMRVNERFINVTSTPPHNIIDQDITEYLPNGECSDEIKALMDFSAEVFKDHPVNQKRAEAGIPPVTHIWLWGSGRKPSFDTHTSMFGTKGVTVAAVDLVKGLAVNAEMDVPVIEGATGYLDTNYEGKTDFVLENWHKYDFFFLHVEAPDEAGHLGSAKEKIKSIENFDEFVVKKIYNLVKDKKESVRVVITPDHATPVSLKTHSREPIPFIVWGKNVEADSTMRYSEKEMSEKGSLRYDAPMPLINDVVNKENIK